MKSLLARLLLIGALSAGLAGAQGRGFGGMRAGAPLVPQQRIATHVARLAAMLNLTDAQQQQATTIFNTAYQSTQALQPSLLQAREVLVAAAKSSSTDIDKLAANLGAIMGQAIAIHAKAFAQFYVILTPAQQSQLNDLQSTGRGMLGMGMGLMGAGGCPFCQYP